MFYYLISFVGQTFWEGLAGWYLCSTWHGRINLVLSSCPRDWFGRRLSVSLRCLVSWRDCFQLSSSFFPCRLLHHGSQTFYMVALSSKRTKWKLSVILMARPRVFVLFWLYSLDLNSPSQPTFERRGQWLCCSAECQRVCGHMKSVTVIHTWFCDFDYAYLRDGISMPSSRSSGIQQQPET